jgi:hypothetical protein
LETAARLGGDNAPYARGQQPEWTHVTQMVVKAGEGVEDIVKSKSGGASIILA